MSLAPAARAPWLGLARPPLAVVDAVPKIVHHGMAANTRRYHTLESRHETEGMRLQSLHPSLVSSFAGSSPVLELGVFGVFTSLFLKFRDECAESENGRSQVNFKL